MLSTLHKHGCGTRVVRPLGRVAWRGEWFEDEQERKCYWYYVSAMRKASCMQC